MLWGKEYRISIIKHINLLILNLNLTGLSRWLIHESQEIKFRVADLGWKNIPLDKKMKKL
jgi:hypothetical protein